MRLKGILDFSLGNFLCLRGYAPMGVLDDLSEPAEGIQRDLLTDHRDEMVAFLQQGEFLFFPEVILCTTLVKDSGTVEDTAQGEAVAKIFEHVRLGQALPSLRFGDYRLSSTASRTRGNNDSRQSDVLQTGTLEINGTLRHKFSRIDGNHRLSATSADERFSAYIAPFCLIFFRNETETKRLSRVLFHNINYKQIPLTMEQNLKLILDDESIFSDDDLKKLPSFGWAYYLARKLHNRVDLDMLPNLKPLIETAPRTFFTKQLEFLLDKNVLGENENAIARFKKALGQVNALLETEPALKDSNNQGLLAALVYYKLEDAVPTASFVRWVLDNHLHLINETSSADLIQIFDQVLGSKKRTIFVSMAFNKTETENHYKIIERVCSEVTAAYSLRPALKVERVDWFHDGTSYEINDKIIEMMSDCGLLIGNLTYCNPNVYHEIGFVMGKARGEGKDTANMLLFLDESVADANKFVGFNLSSIKHLRFSQTEKFADLLQENLKRFFKLPDLPV